MAGRNRETSASILGWLGRSSVAPSIKQEQINLGDASVTSFANKSNKIWKTKKKEKKSMSQADYLHMLFTESFQCLWTRLRLLFMWILSYFREWRSLILGNDFVQLRFFVNYTFIPSFFLIFERLLALSFFPYEYIFKERRPFSMKHFSFSTDTRFLRRTQDGPPSCL